MTQLVMLACVYLVFIMLVAVSYVCLRVLVTVCLLVCLCLTEPRTLQQHSPPPLSLCKSLSLALCVYVCLCVSISVCVYVSLSVSLSVHVCLSMQRYSPPPGMLPSCDRGSQGVTASSVRQSTGGGGTFIPVEDDVSISSFNTICTSVIDL